jgi:hypothetical protein
MAKQKLVKPKSNKLTSSDEAWMNKVKSVMQNATAPKIIHHAGQVNQVEVDGLIIERQDSIYINDIGLVACAPTDNHFVFRDARRLGWTLFCTCGSVAVVTGFDAYKHLGSPSYNGMMLVCKSMLDTSRHQSGEM